MISKEEGAKTFTWKRQRTMTGQADKGRQIREGSEKKNFRAFFFWFYNKNILIYSEKFS